MTLLNAFINLIAYYGRKAKNSKYSHWMIWKLVGFWFAKITLLEGTKEDGGKALVAMNPCTG